jgi:plasmid stabilization system protein ParE
MKSARSSKRAPARAVTTRLSKSEARSLQRTLQGAEPDMAARRRSDEKFEKLQEQLAASNARTSELIREFREAVRALGQQPEKGVPGSGSPGSGEFSGVAGVYHL